MSEQPPQQRSDYQEGEDDDVILEAIFPVIVPSESNIELRSVLMARAIADAVSAQIQNPIPESVEQDEDEGELMIPEILRFMLLTQSGGLVAGQEPGQWVRTDWERLLNASMTDMGGVKMVASDEGISQVKTWVHRAPGPDNIETSDELLMDESEVGKVASGAVCAITQMPFEDGDKIAEMPCGHQFDCDNLMHWLQNESAACPVCRKEVSSREVARLPEERGDQQQQEGVGNVNMLQPLFGLQMRVPARLYVPYDIHGPPAQAEVERIHEDDQIEQAILTAVMRESMSDT
jgi:hypothetical protein